MKKFMTILAFVVLTLFAQCKKQDIVENEEPDAAGIQMVLTVENGGGAKTSIGADGSISWGTNERIFVVANGKCVGSVTNELNGGNTFTGTLDGLTASGRYDFHFYYIGTKGYPGYSGSYLIANGSYGYIMDFSNQDGTLSNLGDFHVGYGSQSGVMVTSGSSVNVQTTMQSLVSVAYFDIANMAEPGSIVYLYGDNINNKLILDFSTNTPSFEKYNPGGKNFICAGTVSDGATSPCYVMLLPNHTNGTEELATDITFVSHRTTGTCNGCFNYGIVGGRFYCEGGNPDNPIEVTANAYPEGILRGEFSVSETKKIRFSQGNLQYIGSASSPYWKFADDQWGIIKTGQNNSNSTTDRDLLGWGTSGFNHGAVCYEPWSTSQTNSDYRAYGIKTANLYDESGEADWGYNAITNGGNVENYGWYTLTQPEWEYLLNTRNTPSGIRWVKATISVSHVIVPYQQYSTETIYGLILLPDDWDESYYSLNSPNSTTGNNTIYSSDWVDKLQVHGAVFLPRNGYRRGVEIYSGGSYGEYWSSTAYMAVYAYALSLTNQGIPTVTYSNGRSEGKSVRLVYPVQ